MQARRNHPHLDKFEAGNELLTTQYNCYVLAGW